MQSEWEALRALCHSLSLWELLRSYENDLPFQTGVILSTTLHACSLQVRVLIGADMSHWAWNSYEVTYLKQLVFFQGAILSYTKSAVRLESVYNCEKGVITLPVSNHKQLANPLSIREEWNVLKSNAWLPQPRTRGEDGGSWMPLIYHLVIGPWALHEAPCCNIHCGWGPYLNDVRKISGTFDPLPPPPLSLSHSRNLSVLSSAFGVPPSPCGRHLSIAPCISDVFGVRIGRCRKIPHRWNSVTYTYTLCLYLLSQPIINVM